MKKYLVAILLIALFATGCGKKETEEASAETVPVETETESAEETIPEEAEETEPEWKKPAFTQEELNEWDEEDFEDEPEPETAEQAEGAALKAELEEKYGFKVRNLEQVTFLTYLDYEELFKSLKGTLYQFGCPNATYIEFVIDSTQLTDDGGRCAILIDGYELENNETVYLSYRNGNWNTYSESTTTINPIS